MNNKKEFVAYPVRPLSVCFTSPFRRFVMVVVVIIAIVWWWVWCLSCCHVAFEVRGERWCVVVGS